jgi:molecular chaperone GrpE
MDPNQDINDLEVVMDDESEDSVSVDDFIRELEAKEKDLHITAETTFIEIEEGFDDANPTAFTILEPEPAPAAPEPAPVFSVEPEAADSREVVSLRSEITELRDKVTELESERSEILIGVQRRSKDFDAFKSRTERERTELMQSQVCDIAGRLLPALDNLHRAIDFAGQLSVEKSEEFRHFFSGMVLVEQQMTEILAGMGIEAISADGHQFDPHLHEAVATEATNEVAANTVTAELLRGYKAGDRVIRHSMVKVAVAADSEAEISAIADDLTPAE